MEVICCKDCAYYSYGGCELIAYIMDGYYRGAEERKPNDFCSKAKKVKFDKFKKI